MSTADTEDVSSAAVTPPPPPRPPVLRAHSPLVEEERWTPGGRERDALTERGTPGGSEDKADKSRSMEVCAGVYLALSDHEQKTYSELFSLCQVEGSPRLAAGSTKVGELFRASQLPAETLHQVGGVMMDR